MYVCVCGMYVCVCGIYVCMYLYIHTYIYNTHTCVCVWYVCMYVCIYTFIHTYIHTRTYARTHTRTCGISDISENRMSVVGIERRQRKRKRPPFSQDKNNYGTVRKYTLRTQSTNLGKQASTISTEGPNYQFTLEVSEELTNF